MIERKLNLQPLEELAAAAKAENLTLIERSTLYSGTIHYGGRMIMYLDEHHGGACDYEKTMLLGALSTLAILLGFSIYADETPSREALLLGLEQDMASLKQGLYALENQAIRRTASRF
ncbi:hypothetical protein [Phenylobacterium immobile]|uniref:hypothetical protein n=1 Tax=Phenylobacterium immobile TaxID=21 RepID=UPI000AAF2E13|nr:hypothetical protein [Phenylobacterium immobile]